MAQLKAWIRAVRETGYGTLHLSRALALAEAAVREGVDQVTVLSDEQGGDFLRDRLPDHAELSTLPGSLTPQQEAAGIGDLMRPHVPNRVDSRNPRPLVYLCGHRYDSAFQRTLWKAGAEVVVIADEGAPTFADWYVIPKPYGGELGIQSVSGYTRFLRGGHYAPLTIRAMKAIYLQRDHRTFAERFAIATENLDSDRWLPAIGRALSAVRPPQDTRREFYPSVMILPGVDCPSDEELRQKLGDAGGLKVTVANGRREHSQELLNVDLLFAADGFVLQQALALGTVRVALPRKVLRGEDLMMSHLIRREASPRIPLPEADDFDEQMAAMLQRVCFDPAFRRGQSRIGQYLCDGIGSIRIIRQTAFKIYTVPQNIIRFFEMGDPIIPEL
ncbi:MAG: hypothetical protein MAG453_02177 [Calditrichaeota bacterium]|nr:hypothetical protein [Calditrichota bacterium]